MHAWMHLSAVIQHGAVWVKVDLRMGMKCFTCLFVILIHGLGTALRTR